MLQRAGFRDVLVDWGGDVKVLGQHPERRGTWRAGVARPPSLEELFARFSAAGGDGGVDTEVVSEIVTLEGGRCLAASGDFGAAPRKCGRRDIACTTRTRAGCIRLQGGCMRLQGERIRLQVRPPPRRRPAHRTAAQVR